MPAAGRSGLLVHGRALPIAVAAGLAMGVFAGLVVVRGTGGSGDEASGGEKVASAGGAGTSGAEGAADHAPGDAGTDQGVPVASSGDGGATLTHETAHSDAAPIAAPPDAAPPPPATAHISFTVDPDDATITAGGKRVASEGLDVPLGPDGTATVDVTVRAHGYHSLHKSYTVRGDRAIRLELHKSHHSGGHHPTGPGGLIHL